MKKLFALLTAVLCVALLAAPVSAASAPGDAFALYQEIVDNGNAVKSLEMKTQAKVEQTLNGETESFKMTMRTKQILRGNDIEMEARTTVDDTDMTIYYKDNYYYMSVAGENYKMRMDLDWESLNQVSLPVTEEMLKDLKVERTDSGKRLTMTIGAEAMNEMMDAVMGVIDFGVQVDTSSIKMGDVYYAINVDKNNMPQSYRIIMYMQEETSQGTVEYKYTLNMKVESVNNTLRIAYPSNLDQYEELDLGALA